MHSKSLGFATILSIAGLALAASMSGCGGGDPVIASGGAGGSQGEKCGNGTVEGKEACDDGNTMGGDGCEADCSFTCDNSSPATGDMKCDDGDACNGTETCSDTHTCTPGKTMADGSACGAGKICVMGACVDDICGDGFINATEECDDANKVDGDGCDSCKFSCDSTDPTRDCTGLDPCVGTTCDDNTHTCGGAIAAGEACAVASVCANGMCTPTVCGNNKLELGEECDDGNKVDGDGCQADCTKPASATCGNGTRDAGEQCDDSNTKNLDGCDSACRFEQVHRANWLHLQFAVEPPFCPANRLGSAISVAAQGQIQTGLDTGIKDGSISILLQTRGLNDLSGGSDPAVDIGFLAAAPVKPVGVTYDGTKDLDWWYTISAASIDANRLPLESLAGFISGKTLHAGPGNVSLGINFAGIPATLKMSQARIEASLGAASKPLTSAGNTPGHRAMENLDPALMSFESEGQPDNTNAGRLCGNVGATSLDQVPIPPQLAAGGGMLACDQMYTTQNSLLDVIVGGCTVFGALSVIVATQPDEADPSVPAAGAGAPYTFTASSMTKAVNGCRDKNNQTADFNMCMASAAYSSFFKFAAGRVIGK